MVIAPVNLLEQFQTISDYWSQKPVGQVNGMQVKLVKLSGEFIWHQHEREDELFLVIKGRLRMCLRDREHLVQTGEFIIVPHGVEHLPIADEETWVLLFEPASTIRTGSETAHA